MIGTWRFLLLLFLDTMCYCIISVNSRLCNFIGSIQHVSSVCRRKIRHFELLSLLEPSLLFILLFSRLRTLCRMFVLSCLGSEMMILPRNYQKAKKKNLRSRFKWNNNTISPNLVQPCLFLQLKHSKICLLCTFVATTVIWGLSEAKSILNWEVKGYHPSSKLYHC